MLLYLHKNDFSLSLDGCIIPVWIDHAAEMHALVYLEPYCVWKPGSSLPGLGEQSVGHLRSPSQQQQQPVFPLLQSLCTVLKVTQDFTICR